MKNVGRLCVALFLLAPQLSLAALAIGQHTTGTANASSVSTTNTSSATTTGSTFIVVAASNQAFSTGSITDTASNTYVHQVSDLQYNGTFRLLNVWTCTNCTGGASFHVTVTFGGGSNSAAVAFVEVTGAATSSIDGAVQTTSGGQTGTTLTGASMTTTNANDLVFTAWANNASSDTFSAPTNTFTLGDQLEDLASSIHLGWGYRIVSSTGTYSSNITTVSSGSASGSAVLAVKATATGGTCTHAALSTTGSVAVPTAGAGSYRRADGSIGTLDCATQNYPQPTNGLAVGVN